MNKPFKDCLKHWYSKWPSAVARGLTATGIIEKLVVELVCH
jgi:hypothetical protein